MTTSPPYTEPLFKGTAFNCPFCNAYAKMNWVKLSHSIAGSHTYTPFHLAYCSHCKKPNLWLEVDSGEDKPEAGRMLLPLGTTSPMPHPEMPASVRFDYEEARSIAGLSPRGAAALLRLVIQKLTRELGEKGNDLNDDIGALVKKGMAVEIQQALDIVRVTGNNAVHPGELSPDDIAEVASSLFELVNQIIEDRIARPKKLDGMFKRLPGKAIDAIKKRDK